MSGRWRADGQLAGMRLDRALCRLAPGLGINAARRFCRTGLATVNGQAGIPPGRRVRNGDILEMAPFEPLAGPVGRLLEISGKLAFLYKPAGLHSVAVHGSAADSLERQLPLILPDYPGSRLLQRLDLNTSGIVCAALDPEAQRLFREMERHGLCEKLYLAVLDGRLERPRVAVAALDVSHRRKSGILDHPADSPLRHTEFFPLATLSESVERTLAGCRIRLGARHQIRAHAASLGLPLAGDELYGGRPGRFRLHHGAIFLPGAQCRHLPDWAAGGQTEDWLSRKWERKN